MIQFIFVLMIAGLTMVANANCYARPATQLDVKLACVPSQRPLVYRCDLQVMDKQLAAPMRINGGSINFDMPSMPMAHNIVPVPLNTDAEGNMKGWEVKLDMHGVWRVRFNFSGESVSRTFNFQSKTVSEK